MQQLNPCRLQEFSNDVEEMMADQKNRPKILVNFAQQKFKVKDIMKGRSKERAKNMEKTLNFIQEVLTELQSKPSVANKEVRLEDFMMQHLLSLYGIDQIASRYLEGWYVSIRHH